MRTLIAHDDEAYEEWGASASVRIDPDSDGRGMSLSITPTWGSAAGEAEQLWSARDPNGLAGNDDFEAKSRLDVELGYGLRAPQGFGLVTPYAELAITDGANRTLFGPAFAGTPHRAPHWTWRPLAKRTAPDTAPANTVMLRGAVRF